MVLRIIFVFLGILELNRIMVSLFLLMIYINEMQLKIQIVPFYFQNVHQGYPDETFVRFLKARDGNVGKAHKMVTFIKLT